jgi:hypothetical protein
MPAPLTDDPSQFPDVAVPVAGEARSAAGITAPVQALANVPPLAETSRFTVCVPGVVTVNTVPTCSVSTSPAGIDAGIVVETHSGGCTVVDGVTIFTPTVPPPAGTLFALNWASMKIFYAQLACRAVRP